MEAVVDRLNMRRAYDRVLCNKGVAGWMASGSWGWAAYFKLANSKTALACATKRSPTSMKQVTPCSAPSADSRCRDS